MLRRLASTLVLAAAATAFVATPRSKVLAPRSNALARARDVRDVRTFSREDDDIDTLEVRLDVTILWCHCLARELFRELTHNPPKAVPGFTTDDLAALGAVVASSSCLSVLWFAFGVVFKQFSRADGDQPLGGLGPTWATVAASSPLWLAFEGVIHAPVSRDEAGVASAVGLLATMSVARLYR